eukprot:scaffold2631_cov412-Prasinococcus_capsulatus_cf.AAC.5
MAPSLAVPSSPLVPITNSTQQGSSRFVFPFVPSPMNLGLDIPCEETPAPPTTKPEREPANPGEADTSQASGPDVQNSVKSASVTPSATQGVAVEAPLARTPVAQLSSSPLNVDVSGGQSDCPTSTEVIHSPRVPEKASLETDADAIPESADGNELYLQGTDGTALGDLAACGEPVAQGAAPDHNSTESVKEVEGESPEDIVKTPGPERVVATVAQSSCQAVLQHTGEQQIAGQPKLDEASNPAKHMEREENVPDVLPDEVCEPMDSDIPLTAIETAKRQSEGDELAATKKLKTDPEIEDAKANPAQSEPKAAEGPVQEDLYSDAYLDRLMGMDPSIAFGGSKPKVANSPAQKQQPNRWSPVKKKEYNPFGCTKRTGEVVPKPDEDF